MKDYIINSFILQDNNTLTDIYNYIKCRYDKSVELNDIKTELTKLIKNNIICFHKKSYEFEKSKFYKVIITKQLSKIQGWGLVNLPLDDEFYGFMMYKK